MESAWCNCKLPSASHHGEHPDVSICSFPANTVGKYLAGWGLSTTAICKWHAIKLQDSCGCSVLTEMHVAPDGPDVTSNFKWQAPILQSLFLDPTWLLTIIFVGCSTVKVSTILGRATKPSMSAGFLMCGGVYQEINYIER